MNLGPTDSPPLGTQVPEGYQDGLRTIAGEYDARALVQDRFSGLEFGLRLMWQRESVFLVQKRLNSKRMTKQQLIEKVADKTQLSKGQVEMTLDSFLEQIAGTLQANERVDLRGFGSFTVKDRKERQGRNPRTGEAMTIPAKRNAAFRPGKELTEKLAPSKTVLVEAPVG